MPPTRSARAARLRPRRAVGGVRLSRHGGELKTHYPVVSGAIVAAKRVEDEYQDVFLVSAAWKNNLEVRLLTRGAGVRCANSGLVGLDRGACVACQQEGSSPRCNASQLDRARAGSARCTAGATERRASANERRAPFSVQLSYLEEAPGGTLT